MRLTTDAFLHRRLANGEGIAAFPYHLQLACPTFGYGRKDEKKPNESKPFIAKHRAWRPHGADFSVSWRMANLHFTCITGTIIWPWSSAIDYLAAGTERQTAALHDHMDLLQDDKPHPTFVHTPSSDSRTKVLIQLQFHSLQYDVQSRIFHVLRHLIPHRLYTGPSMPQAVSRNHQKTPTMRERVRMKVTFFVISLRAMRPWPCRRDW